MDSWFIWLYYFFFNAIGFCAFIWFGWLFFETCFPDEDNFATALLESEEEFKEIEQVIEREVEEDQKSAENSSK